MNHTILLLAMSLSIGLSSSSSQAQTAAAKPPAWNEFTSAYMRFSNIFFPAKDGYFGVIANGADSLVMSTEAFKGSIPAYFNSPEMVKAVSDVDAQARKIKTSVAAKAPDTDILKQLVEMDRMFNTVKDLCKARVAQH